jgi:hypothetical protein
MHKTTCITLDALPSREKYAWRLSEWFVGSACYKSRLMKALAAITEFTKSLLMKLARGH